MPLRTSSSLSTQQSQPHTARRIPRGQQAQQLTQPAPNCRKNLEKESNSSGSMLRFTKVVTAMPTPLDTPTLRISDTGKMPSAKKHRHSAAPLVSTVWPA